MTMLWPLMKCKNLQEQLSKELGTALFASLAKVFMLEVADLQFQTDFNLMLTLRQLHHIIITLANPLIGQEASIVHPSI